MAPVGLHLVNIVLLEVTPTPRVALFAFRGGWDFRSSGVGFRITTTHHMVIVMRLAPTHTALAQRQRRVPLAALPQLQGSKNENERMWGAKCASFCNVVMCAMFCTQPHVKRHPYQTLPLRVPTHLTPPTDIHNEAIRTDQDV
jgi:hypothetical protein